ncbi:MAG: hypothetical protein U0798_03715 [Gemmataceae bacterium]
MQANQKRAEQIIVEILRNASGGLNKGQLYKSFWLAHLYYAKSNRGYLSDWPVVKMPNGPGIHHGDRLLDHLAREGRITVTIGDNGPFPEHLCRIANSSEVPELSREAIQAIQDAVAFASRKSSTELSKLSHEFSREWNENELGREFDMYADLIPAEEIERTKHEVALAMQKYEGLFE